MGSAPSSIPGAVRIRDGWSHCFAPSDEQRALLERELGLGELLRHALDPDEVARVDQDGDRKLVVLRVPVEPKDPDGPGRTATLGIFLFDDQVLTVTGEREEVLERLAKAKDAHPASPVRFVLRAIFCTAEAFLAEQRRIDQRVATLEQALRTSLGNREVLALLDQQHGLVRLTTALRSNQLMLERLRKEEWAELRGADADFLEDVEVELQQASDKIEISEEILGQMMDAFASIISNNLNKVVRALTSLTLILSVPIAVASFYGMNVTLPFEKHPFAFTGLVTGSLALAAVLVVVFKRIKWL